MESIVALAEYQNRQSSDAPTWPEIEPLPPLLPSVPSMTKDLAEEMLPAPLNTWIVDVAERMQTPIETVAVAALGVIASVVGRKIGIYPKQNDNWFVPCVFWTAIIGRPATKKSPVLSEALKPLLKLEEEANRSYESSRIRRQAEDALRKEKIDHLKKEMGLVVSGKWPKGRPKPSEEELKADMEALLKEQKSAELHERRYRVTDSTVEKLGELLRQNRNGILLCRDELTGWLEGLDKQGHEGDRAFFLEGWNASSDRFLVDRIGRGSLAIESICVHVIGGIQPDRITAYVNDAVRGGRGDDGLLQRFQLMVYPDRDRNVEFVDRSPNLEAQEQIVALFKKLDQFNPRTLLAVPEGERCGLRFDEEAQQFFADWYVDNERRYKLSDELEPAFEAHLAKYNRLLPALALLFHLIEWGAGGEWSAHVTRRSAVRAFHWCSFLEAHARKVYAIVMNKSLRGAHALEKKIRDGAVKEGMKVRSIYRRHWTNLGTKEEAEAALGVLEEHGIVRVERVKSGQTWTDVVRLNPTLKSRGTEENS